VFCGKLLVKLYVASLGALLDLFWSTPSHFSRFALVLVGFYEKRYRGGGGYGSRLCWGQTLLNSGFSA